MKPYATSEANMDQNSSIGGKVPSGTISASSPSQKPGIFTKAGMLTPSEIAYLQQDLVKNAELGKHLNALRRAGLPIPKP